MEDQLLSRLHKRVEYKYRNIHFNVAHHNKEKLDEFEQQFHII